MTDKHPGGRPSIEELQKKVDFYSRFLRVLIPIVVACWVVGGVCGILATLLGG